MLSMFLLIFQLTASGGTFPTELTQGGLFMALHPFMPFTYSVNALREAISGVPIDWKVFSNSIAVQLCIATGALVICMAFEALNEKRRLNLDAASA
jgi:putative membrane protein